MTIDNNGIPYAVDPWEVPKQEKNITPTDLCEKLEELAKWHANCSDARDNDDFWLAAKWHVEQIALIRQAISLLRREGDAEKAIAFDWFKKHVCYWEDELPILDKDCPPIIKQIVEENK